MSIPLRQTLRCLWKPSWQPAAPSWDSPEQRRPGCWSSVVVPPMGALCGAGFPCRQVPVEEGDLAFG